MREIKRDKGREKEKDREGHRDREGKEERRQQIKRDRETNRKTGRQREKNQTHREKRDGDRDRSVRQEHYKAVNNTILLPALCKPAYSNENVSPRYMIVEHSRKKMRTLQITVLLIVT